MEVSATAKYIRMSPRKVRLVVDAVRGRSVEALVGLAGQLTDGGEIR